MAKTSQIHRDLRRARLIEKYAERRKELREQLKDRAVSMDEKFEIQVALSRSRTSWMSSPLSCSAM